MLFRIAQSLFSSTVVRAAASTAAAASLATLTVASAAEHPSQGGRVVIVGGGTGGIVTAAQLRKKNPALQITIVEPHEWHYYQPLWTMVGGGLFNKEESRKPMKEVIPAGVTHVSDRVSVFNPDSNTLTLASGQTLPYDYLVVAAGLQVNFGAVKGLAESVGKNGVCSIYDFHTVTSVWESVQNTRRGNALFTVPATGIKCGGAPQKIMYLAEDHFRTAGVRDNIRVEFASAMGSMFPVAHYGAELDKLRQGKGIEASFGCELVEVRGDKKEAVFKTKDGLVTKSYEMLHVVPPMGAPDFIKASPLANAAGFVDVDKETLQHTKYSNVFSLGDCSSLPTSKTAAAITGEAPVLVANLCALHAGQPLKHKYDGYTSCPIITGKDSLMLAEFTGPGYGGHIRETFPVDQRTPRYAFFLLKKYLFPHAYWNWMLSGNWYGKDTFFNPCK